MYVCHLFFLNIFTETITLLWRVDSVMSWLIPVCFVWIKWKLISGQLSWSTITLFVRINYLHYVPVTQMRVQCICSLIKFSDVALFVQCYFVAVFVTVLRNSCALAAQSKFADLSFDIRCAISAHLFTELLSRHLILFLLTQMCYNNCFENQLSNCMTDPVIFSV